MTRRHEPLESALAELDAITRRLRRECPWDREQNERSIVPHTVEEAYELAEAAHSGDDTKMLDELGDVLFQVYFLSLLLEERGHGDLESVARSCVTKLVRRHPHVFGGHEGGELDTLPTEARTPSQVRRNWDEIKRREPGAGGDPMSSVPDNLPALLYARKLQKRSSGEADLGATIAQLRAALERIVDAAAKRVPGAADHGATHGSEALYERLGELLFATVRLSRALQVDPEIALRLHADRFQERAMAKRAGG